MPSEPVHEIVLAAVGFVCDDNDVAAFGQGGKPVALLLGEELLDGGEHHATGRHLEQLAKLCSVLRLDRGLPQELRAPGELSEQLVVQVIAVGEDDQRRVVHRRMEHHTSGEKGHREALP